MDGGKFQQLLGSRRQVFNGTAKKTNYGKNGLEKKDLKMNKHGLIVSAKKSKTAKKSKHLGKFLQKKGSKTFGPRKTAKKSKKGGKSKMKMGGMDLGEIAYDCSEPVNPNEEGYEATQKRRDDTLIKDAEKKEVNAEEVKKEEHMVKEEHDNNFGSQIYYRKARIGTGKTMLCYKEPDQKKAKAYEQQNYGEVIGGKNSKKH